MTCLLRLDASARTDGSHSRELADFFQSQWVQAFPDGKIVVRDVNTPAVPHVTELMIRGFQSPPENRTDEMKKAIAISDELIGELKLADYLLISVPMYNFSVPSALKAWIDQVVRGGETFAMEDNGFKGLLETKKAFICTAYGAAGYRNAGPMASLNFLEPYLQGLFGFLGVQDFEFFAAEGMMADASVQASVKTEIKESMAASIAQLG